MLPPEGGRHHGSMVGSAKRNPEQFQEKCETVGLGDFAVAFRPELRQNKKIERFAVSVKR
ncbi:MAG: hypothetical protein E5X48_17760 [Mesorhizobium sp.]|uniref:hypothetical protein n=1 Tax=Mesorhizobium sp. TaxID=1871066 RepID=UPI0012179257|nr:hypothetical protein [Mesorhizobium sp.]TIQ34746.1 MAG: hypothetical protein E5X48_17760 [Mesorhizobium sp.]